MTYTCNNKNIISNQLLVLFKRLENVNCLSDIMVPSDFLTITMVYIYISNVLMHVSAKIIRITYYNKKKLRSTFRYPPLINICIIYSQFIYNLTISKYYPIVYPLNYLSNLS